MVARLSIVLFLLLAGGCSKSPQDHAGPATAPWVATSLPADAPAELRAIDTLLQRGAVSADVFALIPSDRLQELSGRFQVSVSTQPEWFIELTRKTPAGATMPYDTRMGLNEKEYHEMLDLMNKSGLQRVTTIQLEIKATGPHIYQLHSDSIPGLAFVTIDLMQARIATPFGVLTEHECGPQSLRTLGGLVGCQWRLKQGDLNQDMDSTLVRFLIGRLGDGRGIVRYEAKQGNVKRHQIKSNFTWLITFPARSPQTSSASTQGE
jgi:hypothetical protein